MIQFKGERVRKELGISIKREDIVLASGGFPCGEWPYMKIANDLYEFHEVDEITLAAKKYSEFFLKGHLMTLMIIEGSILAKHETLNGKGIK